MARVASAGAARLRRRGGHSRCDGDLTLGQQRRDTGCPHTGRSAIRLVRRAHAMDTHAVDTHETDTATDAGAIGFDPDELRARYRHERDKRVRAEGADQYVEMAGRFAKYAEEDPYVEPGFS